jgi:membrane-associated phospholipid phosphatase
MSLSTGGEYFLLKGKYFQQMENKLRQLIILLILFPVVAFTQSDSLLSKPVRDKHIDAVEKRLVDINPSAYDEVTPITLNNYFTLLGRNLEHEFTKPFNMRARDWGNFGKFAVIFGALCFSDEQMQKSSVKLASNNPAVKNSSYYITKFGGAYERYTLAALTAYGLIFKNTRLLTTALLATQAYITGSAVEVTLKALSGRTRPNYYSANEEAEPRFLGPFAKLGRDAKGKKRYSSFPSGHSIIAFGAATVFSEEYKNIKYLGPLAYSAATLVGLSRLTENKHWATDILTGAAIGYLTGKNVVNNYHHYANRGAGRKNKNSVSCNFQYFNGRIIPGVIYKFR